MKHFVLFVLLASFWTNSCTQKKSFLTYTQKYFTKEGTIIHDGGRPKIDLEIHWFSSQNGVADSINKKIFQTIARFTYSEYSQIGKTKSYEELVDFYIEDAYQIALEGEEGYASSYLELSTDVHYQTSDLLNISLTYQGYIGGAAHENYGVYSMFFDPKTGEKISLEDIFIHKEEFKKVSERFFRKQYEIPEQENINSYGFWFENDTFELPPNIIITQDKIFLFYNPYEIGSYAEGMLIIEIPISKAKKFLKYVN